LQNTERRINIQKTKESGLFLQLQVQDGVEKAKKNSEISVPSKLKRSGLFLQLQGQDGVEKAKKK